MQTKFIIPILGISLAIQGLLENDETIIDYK